MKKLASIFCLIFTFAINANAQIVYQDGYLTFGRDRYPDYMTSWAGWAHYWGSTNSNGIKMHIHAADPRMSTTVTVACTLMYTAARCIRIRMKN